MLSSVTLVLAGALLQNPQAQAPPAGGPASISGRVLEDGTNAPVSGATVRLMLMRQAPPVPGAAFTPPPTATSDAAGRFAFPGLEPGRYMLSAQKTGYAAPGPGGAPNRPIEVAAGEHRSDASIVLLRGAVITGRVLDAAGQPLADARVTALRRPPVPPAGAAGRGPMAPPMMMVPGGSVQANDLGEFRLHSLAPGEYFIQAAPQSAFGAQASGDRTVLAPTFYPGTTSMSAAQGVTVTGGQTYGEIVVRLVTAVTYQISGIVVDQNGAPVEGAMVSLMPDRSTTPMPMMMMGPNGRIRTDAAGRFTVNGVLDGQYTIAAAAPIVLTRSNGSTGASGGISFGASGNVSGVVSGSAAASVARGTSTMTETTANGVTTQFRTEQADQVALTINGADVTGLQLVAPRR